MADPQPNNPPAPPRTGPTRPTTTTVTSPAENDLLTQRRAARAASLGLLMQFVLAIVAYAILLMGRAVPLWSVLYFAAAGLIPWLAIVIASAFRKAKTVEEFELEAARRSGEAADTIFESEADARPAARRLNRVYKFGLPAAAILLGLVMVLLGFARARAIILYPDLAYRLQNPTLVAGIAAGFAFVGFVFGRYLLGMSTRPAWSLLRGGAGYLIGTVYILALMAASAGASSLGVDGVNGVVRYVVPIFMLLVGIEVLLNVVLDLYRPRVAGQAPRPAFDSRALALLSSPGGVVKSLNEAINYQFGFDITRSWFWRLLARSFVWLILFGVGVLVVVSSFVLIEPFERGLVTRFGKLDREPLEPGLHIKAPWPFATVERFPVDRIRELVVGSHDQIHQHDFYLWTNQHTEPERLLIVAPSSEAQLSGTTSDIATAQGQAPPSGPSVALAAADLYVQWRIDADKLIEYVGNSSSPSYRLRQLAETALARQMLRYDIDSAIGSARSEIAAHIQQQLRDSVESENLGIEVVWVGIAGVAPAQTVAESFNQSVAARQNQFRLREEGAQQSTALLTRAAGSAEQARRIVAEKQVLDAMEAGRQPADEAEIAAQRAEVERLIQQAGGTSAEALLQARSRRWTEQNRAVAESARLPAELAQYRAAPQFYRSRRYLDVLRQTMVNKNKIVLVAEVLDPLLDLDLRQTIDALSNLSSLSGGGSDQEQ